MDDAERALAEVRRQREAMAARVRLPWWFRVLIGVVWAGWLVSPVLALEHERFGLPALPYMQVAGAVLLVVLIGFRRRSGLHTTMRSWAYPSLRGKLPVTAVVVVGGVVVVWGLALAGLPYPAIAFVLPAAAFAVGWVGRINAGIRRDVLEGR